MRIKYFVFGASALVAVLFFGATYWALDRIFDNIVRANAARTSEATTRITFASMYQLMSQGWRRSQADAFLHAMAAAGKDTGLSVQIYRSQMVVDLYDEIDQPPLDADLKTVFASAKPLRRDTADYARHIYPLVAEAKCQRCHRNADIGAVLGAVEVRQEYASLLADARRELYLAFALLVPLTVLLAGAAVWWVGRRIEGSLEGLQADFDRVEAIGRLLDKLRAIAIDKDVLTFEIGLLEKFVITSDVVRDWRDYVGRLLGDINGVLPGHTRFSILKIDDELFDLEIFWRGPATEGTRAMMEQHIRRELANLPSFGDVGECNIHHHVSNAQTATIDLTEAEVALRVKSFFVDKPKIGGIVGIGVHAGVLEDETRYLVMESVLSTLLNLVGSVKAIYKYTRDLEYYATRDPLTDLFNQRVFWELSSYEIGRAQRHGYSFGLLLIDLD